MRKKGADFILAAVFSAAGFLGGALSADCQPNTKLRPNETIFLYLDADAGRNDDGTARVGDGIARNGDGTAQASEGIARAGEGIAGKTDVGAAGKAATVTADRMTDPVVGKKVSSAGFEMCQQNGLSGAETIGTHGNLGNISDSARFDIYIPKKANGQMVIVCPGGGYAYVSSYNEGVYVADWMLERGVTVAVVKYRLPNGHWEVPLEDVQNAFRYCRAHASEWGVDQIGVMGFSAGGHLAATVSTMYSDAATRPDFSVLIYPVITMDMDYTHMGTRNNLIGSNDAWSSRDGMSWSDWNARQAERSALEERYSLENQVTADTPPTFIALSNDDGTVPPENTLRYWRSLVGNGVSAEVHVYPLGGHGWGFTSLKFSDQDRFDYARGDFEASLGRWLESVR